MVLELDRRYPGLGRQIEESMRWRSTEKSSRTPTSPAQPRERIYLIPKIGAADAPLRLMTTPARGGEHRGETADRFHSSGCPAAPDTGSTPFPFVAQSRV